MAAPTEHRLDAAARIEALPDDDLRHEYLAGEHVVTPPQPAGSHAGVASAVHDILTEALPAGGPERVVQAVNVSKSGAESFLVPDIAVVSRAALREERLYFAPVDVKLVVEITSPSTRRRDMTTKAQIYGAWKLPYLVLERQTLTVWRFEDGKIADVMVDDDPFVVPGWTFANVTAKDLFEL